MTRPDRPTRRRPLSIEGLEGRDLMSASPLKADLSLVPVFEAMAYPATVGGIPNPQPTQAEVSREYFTARLSGTYTVTAGHFAGQAATVKIASTTVSSNQFAHGKGQVIIETAADAAGNPDPTASFFGTAAIFPENTIYSGESVVLDLEGNPSTNPSPATAAYDQNGLPTHMVWVPDTASGTGYTGANGFGQGYGDMDAVYHPDKHPQKGTIASGKVTMLYQGLINKAGILSYDDPLTQ